MNLDDIDSNFNKGRKYIYEFLYYSFYKVPDKEYISYAEKIIPFIVDILKYSRNNNLTDIMKNFLEHISKSCNEDFYIDMNTSYTRLFICADRVLDREYQWRNNNSSKEEIIISLQNIYDKHCIEKPARINMPIDSISMELYLLYKLVSQKLYEDEIYLFENHLLCWIEEYCKTQEKKCSDKLSDRYYYALFIFCRLYILSDYLSAKNINGEI